MRRSDEIGTARLWLRPPRETDAQQICARYAKDPEVCRYMSWTPHQSIDDTHAFLSRIIGDNAAGRSRGFLILCESGELLGSIGGAIDQHRMGFGYCLARDTWGHGIATEAARAFVASVLENPAICRIQAYCDVENRASARVLEKVGLELEGTLRQYLVLPNLGESPRDVYCYAKVRVGAANPGSRAV